MSFLNILSDEEVKIYCEEKKLVSNCSKRRYH